MVQWRCSCTWCCRCSRGGSLFLPLLSSPAASGHFAVVLSSLSLFALSIRLTLLSSVSASVVQFICLQGQSPLDTFILRSLVQFLLCSVHVSLVAVFFPIIQVWPSDGHYTYCLNRSWIEERI